MVRGMLVPVGGRPEYDAEGFVPRVFSIANSSLV